MDETTISLRRFSFRKDLMTKNALDREMSEYISRLQFKRTTHETELYHFYWFLHEEHPDIKVRLEWERYDDACLPAFKGGILRYQVSEPSEYTNLRLIMIVPTQAIVLYRLEQPGRGMGFLKADYIS